MPVTVKKAGVHKPTKQPYVNVTEVQKAAKKVFLKKAGAWIEVWPRVPNPPTNVHITTPIVGDDVTISGTWSAPAAGATPADKYQVRFIFTDPVTAATLVSGWVDRTLAQLSYTNDNSGSGWQHRAGQKVHLEVVSVTNATAWHYEQRSTIASSEIDTAPGAPKPPVVVIPPTPVPAIPTNFDINIVACDLTQTWNHPGTNLDKFEIQTWVGTNAPTTYTVGKTLRSWTTQPWNAATVGRQYTYSRIRAVGQGGASAWVTLSGVMPGPVAFTDLRFEGGVLKVGVAYNYDGMAVYRQKYGGNPVFQGYVGATSGWYTLTDTASSGYARDNASNYRIGIIPRNSANGWTGRTQWTDWAIKLPNPVHIQPGDCNTWWSIPIPGKWRTNPQADDWFYQGKSISGNSYGCLFYQKQVSNYFATSRIGYTPTPLRWYVYVKRTWTGGLVAAVALNTWTISTADDSVNAAPSVNDGPQVGPALARNQQAWVELPNGWFYDMMSNVAKGIAFYVPPGQADNQLRSEIGNVSNRYMILDKPQYGAHLEGHPPGTLRIYHDG